MNNPKVSVIVAVYNAEAYLDRCMKSLLEQTLTDFEILLIDDGSTDKSGKMCDNYAAIDQRIRIFHKPNGGVGSARKLGIEQACGEYTIHVDPDDWVENDMLEKIYQKASADNVDMVVFDYYQEFGHKTVRKCCQPSSTENPSILISNLFSHMGGSCCNKLTRLSCYRKNDINFIDGLNYGEDLLVNVRLLLTGISVSYYPEAFYHYDHISNPSSYTKGVSTYMIEQRIRFADYLLLYLPDTEVQKLGVNKTLINAAYLAIKSKVNSKKTYLKKFDKISKLKWKEYNSDSQIFNFIVWSSFHIGYNYALFFIQIKNGIHSIRQKMKHLQLHRPCWFNGQCAYLY